MASDLNPEARPLRPDHAVVARWIAPGSSVLDLGCGDGSLLAWLQREKQCRCVGVELDDANVLASVKNGVEVVQQNLEDGLALFSDASFDIVVQLESLQMVRHTEVILAELGRVGRESIVTFPNFAYWSHRVAILSGRMPVTKTLPYQWYDTPNLRVTTLPDFADLAEKNGFTLLAQSALHEGKPVTFLPNLFGSLALFRLRSNAQAR